MDRLEQLLRNLRDRCPELELRTEEPMSRHTTFRIGGPAALMALPRTVGEAKAAVRAAGELEIRPFFLGNGSNLLAADRGWEGFIIKTQTGLDALEWIRQGVDRGAGEVVVNSIDTDGVKGGFDLEMLAAVCQAVKVPVIASGGAGRAEDFVRLFQTLPGVDAGLAASVFHFGEIAIPHLKAQLRQAGISVR